MLHGSSILEYLVSGHLPNLNIFSFFFLFFLFCGPFKDALICQSSVIVYMPFCLVIVHHASLPLPMPLEDCFIIVVLRIYQTVHFLTLNEPKRQKQIFWFARPTKTQISLRIRAVWSESLLFAWRKFASLGIQNALSEDSDQTARMRRLIWIFAVRTCSEIRFLTFRHH